MTYGRIDVHAHLIGVHYRNALTPPGVSPAALAPATRAALERMMSGYGIDAAVISTGPPGAAGHDPDQINRLVLTELNRRQAYVSSTPRSTHWPTCERCIATPGCPTPFRR